MTALKLKSHMIILTSFLFLHFFFISCSEDEGIVNSVGDTSETSFGTVAKIDNYPLFTLNYKADYEFDEYLQSGTFPRSLSRSSEGNNFYCTCFAALGSEDRIVGRNYDWASSSSYFLVFTNPTDAYASVSTVDLGFFEYDHNVPPDSPDNLNTLSMLPYYPFDGMNEKGVAVGMNALSYSQGPYDPTKVTIGELQLIRLVLDYAASTNEAIDLIHQYNIRMEDPPVHYLIADSSGHSAVIEFIDGEMIVMNNANLWQVTTNFVITGLEDHGSAPCWRYRGTYQTLRDNKGICSQDEAVSILINASVPSTRWSNVFNLKDGKIQIAMGRSYENFFEFDLRE
jgi:hypothetical protein